MLTGRDKANKTVEHAQRTGEALQGITTSVDTINLDSKIASAIETQTDNAGLINSNIVSISAISNESATSAGDASKFAHEMSLMAYQLKGLVQQFLLSDNKSNDTVAHPDLPVLSAESPANRADDIELF